MNEIAEMNEMVKVAITPQMMIVVPVVVYVIQVFKKVPYSSYLKPYLPLLSMALGVGGAYLFSVDNPLVAGLFIGMMASTGYKQFAMSGTKPLTDGEQK